MKIGSECALPWIIALLVAVVALWLTYKLIDQSVTVDHQTQYAKLLLQQRDVLVNVVNAISIGEQESIVRQVLLDQATRMSVFEKEKGAIVAGQVTFVFRDGKLIRVDTGDR